jgi:hypothetical protein
VVLKRVVTLDTGSIPAGGFVDVWYAPEVNLRLKRIIVVETTADATNLIFMTFYLGDVPFFFPNISASLLRHDVPVPIVFDLTHPAGVKLTMRITNSDSAARRVLIHLVYEE